MLQSTSLQKLIVVTAQSAIRIKSYVVDEIELCYTVPLLALILVLLEVRLADAHLTIGKYPKKFS